MSFKVSPLDELVKDARPVEELPGFVPDKPFYARIQRVSLLSLIHAGKVPNELMAIAHKLSAQGSGWNPVTESTPDELKQFTNLLHVIASTTLVEPTYEDLQAKGIFLTDDQLSALFVFATRGVEALSSFRERQRTGLAPSLDSEDVEESAE